MKKQTLLIILLTIIATMWTGTASAEPYIFIAGNPYTLTGYIKNEHITSGTVYLNPKDKTLTLDNAHIDYDNGCILNNMIDGLTVIVKGDCYLNMTLEKTNYPVIRTDYSITITGDGTLYLTGDGNSISTNTNDPINVTIDGCRVICKNSTFFGIAGRDTQTLTIRNSTVKTIGSGFGSIAIWGDIKLEDCYIKQPEGATIGSNSIGGGLAVINEKKTVMTEVVIEPRINYNFTVAGTEITSLNNTDLSVIDGVSGKVSYEPTTKTLTLNNATINTTQHGIYAQDELNIVLNGTVNITSSNGNAIYSTETTGISGSGTLNATSKTLCGILINDLTIDGCKVNAKGLWGIAGNSGNSEKLTIRNATVTAEGSVGSIREISSLTLSGCEITSPTGAAFSESLHGVALSGKLTNSKVEIKPTASGIVTTEAATVPTSKSGIYNLQGVYLGTSLDALPEGIYIVNGKKILK